jgi:tetratricopeptide (TPR) repeat protein
MGEWLMKSRLRIGMWPRLVFVSIAVALLGIAPRPHAYRQALEQARLAMEGGRPADTAAAVAQAAQLAPWRADLWEQAGIFAFQGGDVTLATQYLQEAQRVGGDAALSPQAWLTLGDIHQRAGAWDKALSAWASAIAVHGPSLEALSRLEKAHLHLGDWPAAADDLRRQIELAPENAQLHYRLGLMLSFQEPETALEALDQAAALEPRHQDTADAIRRALLSARFAESPAYTRLAVGRALAGLGEWDLAAEAFRRAVRERPDYAEAWAYLGEARQHAGQGTLRITPSSSSDGFQELQNALKLDPKSLAARTFLALYWTRQGDVAQALQTMREAAALDPNNPALQVQFASLQAQTGDLGGAQQAYERAIDLSPYDPAYRRALVTFALEYDYQVEELALPLARRLVSEYPDNAPTLELMGRILLKRNDLAGAERFLLRATQEDTQSATAHLHLGLVYALRGERALARQELNLAIDLAGDDGPTAAQARRLLETYFP